MGLEEKRWLAQERDEVMPEAQRALREIAGCELTYVVDWDSFANDLEALQNLQHQGFGRINDAFRDLCRDDVGKSAVKDALDSVHLQNLADPAEKSVTLADRTVRVRAAWGAGDGYFVDAQIAKAISDAL
jgi:hypothetical protein